MEIFNFVLDLMRKNENIKIYNSGSADKYVPVISFNLNNNISANENYSVIEEKFNVVARSGLHCSPAAHKLLGTLKLGGTIRFSFSYFSEKSKEISKIIAAF